MIKRFCSLIILCVFIPALAFGEEGNLYRLLIHTHEGDGPVRREVQMLDERSSGFSSGIMRWEELPRILPFFIAKMGSHQESGIVVSLSMEDLPLPPLPILIELTPKKDEEKSIPFGMKAFTFEMSAAYPREEDLRDEGFMNALRSAEIRQLRIEGKGELFFSKKNDALIAGKVRLAKTVERVSWSERGPETMKSGSDFAWAKLP